MQGRVLCKLLRSPYVRDISKEKQECAIYSSENNHTSLGNRLKEAGSKHLEGSPQTNSFLNETKLIY